MIFIFAIAAGLLLVGSPAGHASEKADRADNRYFRGLTLGLKQYQHIAQQGGWPKLSDGPSLRRGVSDPNVELLRRRLALTSDLAAAVSQNSDQFGEALEQAVIRFQRRNGIEPDGIVGPETLATLNIPVSSRLKQIRVNLNRWGRMPGFLGEHFVLVNQAGFELEVISGDHLVLEMRVIVGKNYRQTPIFSDEIQYVDVNPVWNVPVSIAKKDLVPKFAKDPSFPAANGFEAFENGKRLDVQSIDWNAYSDGRLPFELKQKAGPQNALGRVKIMFPNKYNVYLHDTPTRGLFDKTVRAFSSGCIRLENPIDLVRHLLAGNPSSDLSLLDAALQSGKTVRIPLKQKVPVHLVYMTAWLDRAGQMQFRPDIYGRDATLAQEANLQ